MVLQVDQVELHPVTALAIPSPNGETSPNEYLLCYNFVGVLVNEAGRQSRRLDLRWFGKCHGFVLAPPFVLCFGEDTVQV